MHWAGSYSIKMLLLLQLLLKAVTLLFFATMPLPLAGVVFHPCLCGGISVRCTVWVMALICHTDSSKLHVLRPSPSISTQLCALLKTSELTPFNVHQDLMQLRLTLPYQPQQLARTCP